MSSGLGQLLLEQGVVDEATLRTATAQPNGNGESLAKTLIAMGAVTEAQVAATVAGHLGMAFADTTPGGVDPEAASLIAPDIARELGALPVAFGQDSDLIVAVTDPANTAALERITALTGLHAVPALAARGDLRAAIEARGDVSVVAEADPGLLAFEQEQTIDLDTVLADLLTRGGSDLHLTAGVPPMIRVNGELQPLDDYPVLTPEELQKMLYSILTQKQREIFENDLELDVSYAVPKLARFRVNIFQQRDAIASVMRVIPFEIKSIEDLGIPAQVVNFAHLPRGFVLVTGPTGSGKSTTLAALIDVINRERAGHIITVEDPIEFLHAHKRSIVNQRELGTDTLSFAQALKHVLRQDPDVILVGEMRDLETIQVALTAAETGHLVFGTLHTQDAPQTIDRVIDVFPPEQQEQIRVMLGGALQGVMCQQLLKTTDGKGRVVACEVMVATPAIRNLIREGKTHQMYSAIQAGKAHGMVTMDQSLANLVLAGKVTHSMALEKCNNVPDFNRLCGKG
ncbi:MAG TPA: PilT/PilU family type 4a pilus ATPase [Egibacteraceae bacterium]|nr:PilT/PilU family type 4a pilus ATPase [Egibacteraceae bacterium]